MIVTITASFSILQNPVTRVFDQGGWYYEVDTGDEVVHSDGFFPDRDIALQEGDEWAKAQGYTVHVT